MCRKHSPSCYHGSGVKARESFKDKDLCGDITEDFFDSVQNQKIVTCFGGKCMISVEKNNAVC